MWPYRLIVFGHLSRNRRLDALFQALASFPERKRFHLDIYGSVPDGKYLDAQIDALDLRPLVTVHGFVPEEALDQALQAADLALNLRYPAWARLQQPIADLGPRPAQPGDGRGLVRHLARDHRRLGKARARDRRYPGPLASLSG